MTRPYNRHNGGKCPVAPDTLVDIQLRDGSEIDGLRASNLDWHYFGPDYDDIVGWRLSEPDELGLWWLWLALVILGLVAFIVWSWA
ncbi:MAG: hypothetical protein RLZZ09_806 [Pseudomonadota bacterium]|jgi:hypothetical protein